MGTSKKVFAFIRKVMDMDDDVTAEPVTAKVSEGNAMALTQVCIPAADCRDPELLLLMKEELVGMLNKASHFNELTAASGESRSEWEADHEAALCAARHEVQCCAKSVKQYTEWLSTAMRTHNASLSHLNVRQARKVPKPAFVLSCEMSLDAARENLAEANRELAHLNGLSFEASELPAGIHTAEVWMDAEFSGVGR